MKKILLVDDESLVREAFKCAIEGIEDAAIVGEADSGNLALELASSLRPDIIFLDSNIPGMNILDCLRKMKDGNGKGHITLLADFDDMDLIPLALETGADTVLTKPYTLNDISQIVNQYHILEDHDSETMDQMMDGFIDSVFRDDFKSAKDLLKKIGQHFYILNDRNPREIRATAEFMAERLTNICRKKGLKLQRKMYWMGKIQTIDLYTFEQTMSAIVEEIFEEIMSSATIQEKKAIQSVLNYIEKHFEQGVTLEEVAEFVHLSPFYLSKLFKKELNINFVNYLTERKMERAKELLEMTDMPVVNIALCLSYQEPNYFSKVFKKMYGMTPSEYRKQKEKEHKNELLLKKHTPIGNGRWYV
ncbi:helix-turn-helix domain-containing protein [Neobacillus sp. Marseille-QA0830]